MYKITIIALSLFCVSIQSMVSQVSAPKPAPKPVASYQAPSKEAIKGFMKQMRPRL